MAFLLCHLPFLAGILIFLTLHLGLTLMKATASYSYEGLVAADIEPYAADRDGVSDKGCESRLSRYPQAVFKLGAPSERLLEFDTCSNPLSHHGRFEGLY